MSQLTIRPIVTGYVPTYKKQYHYHHSTHAYRNVDDTKLLLPAIVYLIEGGDQLVLVDTGMADTYRADKYHHPGSIQPEGFAIHERLAQIGLKPEDVGLVVFTHLHWDHMYYMDKFTKAKFIAHRKEYEFALDPIPLYYKSYEHPALGIRRPFEGLKVDVVDGEEELMPGVRVFPSPGHSPGHQSVEIDTAEGTYICCGDSIFIYDNLDPIPEIHYNLTPPARFANIVECWKSIEELKARAKAREYILPSHEPAIEELLKRQEVIPAPRVR
ncbi:MAG: N-acyl homoserine lactonase family protein [Bacillota bacterium]|nr:N-acyl homoserine lactonase family protein [Bacillota bacterium]